jgi:RNA polymerase sigma-70 factor (ECF subfamily)
VVRGSAICVSTAAVPLAAPGGTEPAAVAGGSADDRTWISAFHAGDRELLEGCYRAHFQRVDQVVGRVLRGADRETVVQEIFLQLLSNPQLRRSFVGGAFGAWIATVARSRAIDFWRRYRRERGLDAIPSQPPPPGPAAQLEARLLIAQFLRDECPPKWAGVFEARFLAQLDQRTAAQRLGIGRTTLAYQELQVRRLLKRFLLRDEDP